MNVFESTVFVQSHTLRNLNDLLRSKDYHSTCEDVMYVVTGEFANGCQADIKLVNGEPPYVDPVLFDSKGFEMAAGEPDSETFNNDYEWIVGGDKYVLHVKVNA